MTYGEGRFVAVGDDRRAASADGLTWEVDEAADGAGLTAVAYGNGAFVAVGDALQVSTDGGATWQAVSLGGGGWSNVVFGGGLFLLGDGSEVWSSEDGLDWTFVNAGGVTPIARVGRVSFGTSGSAIHRSDDDGFSWTTVRAADGGPSFGDAALSWEVE